MYDGRPACAGREDLGGGFSQPTVRIFCGRGDLEGGEKRGFGSRIEGWVEGEKMR